MAQPFPDGFVWGAATAAYQVEGAVRLGGRGESIWDRFAHTPGSIGDGTTGDHAADAWQWSRWLGDIEIMRDLGLQAYRMSISWPRIVPSGRGKPNREALDAYERQVDAVLAAGITPWLTLYHWDLPQALEENGGWPNRSTAGYFAEYVDAVTRQLGDRVRHWITFDDPWSIAFRGHLLGTQAPGKRSLPQAIAAAHTLLLAHGTALEVIRGNVRDAHAGIALNLSQIEPGGDSELDERAAVLTDGVINRWWLDALSGRGYPEDVLRFLGDFQPAVQYGDLATIAGSTDFLGIDTFQPAFVRHDPKGLLGAIGFMRVPGDRTATDDLVRPEALPELLKRVHADYAPASMVITANGSAWNDPPLIAGRIADERRTAYLRDHLLASREAVAAGVPLQGYFAWSLLDGFAWEHGLSARYGLVHVDYATEERTIKDSGRLYADTIRANGENL